MAHFPEKSPENRLVLVEGSCGKVTHDLKLSGGSLRSVYSFLEANGEELRVLCLGQVQVLPHGAPSEEISPRGCQKVP